MKDTTVLAFGKDISVQDYNAAVKLMTRIEHRMGEVLKETVRQGRPSSTKPDGMSGFRLNDDITEKTSSRAQQLASKRREAVDELRRRLAERFPDAAKKT